MKTRLSYFLATTAIAVPVALAGVPAAAAEDIGKVAAVNPSMDGTPPQETASRSLALGSGVIQNERIETSEDGSGQLLFVDQTTLSIAPRSDIVLDRYVYDPGDESGEVEMTLTKGVLRLIGGRITKRTDGIIKTPAATIGVRGGLALVVVEGSMTRVCHIAGEYTKVTGFAGGEIVLSRPNACAVVELGAAATFQGLIDADELARIYRQIEGRGTGGALVSAEAIEIVAGEGLNNSKKRGPYDQPVSTSGHRYASDTLPIREDQQLQDYGVRTFQVDVPDEEGGTARVVVTTTVPNLPPDPPRLTGGSVISAGEAGTEYFGFSEVLLGSLIGRDPDGNELRVPVPNTGGSSDAEFNTPSIRASRIGGAFEFTATDLAPSSGLFEFFVGGTGNSDLIGQIEGVGFNDPGENFTYVEFSSGGDFPAGHGFAAFGSATVNQGQFVADDATITRVPGSASGLRATIDPALLTPDLPNGVANTVEAFMVQPSLYLDSAVPPRSFIERASGSGSRMGQTPFYMIGNQGFARVPRPETTVSTGGTIAPGELTGGGKWLNGALYISPGDSGFQDSRFFAFGDDIRNYEGSGPIVGGTGYESAFFGFFDPEFAGTVQAVSAGEQNLGTLEDLSGNTMFGQDNRYLVLSNLHRPGLEGDSAPPDYSSDAGSEVALFQGGSGSTSYYRAIGPNNDFATFLSYDRSRDEAIPDPLPLAGARIERDAGSGAISRTQNDHLDRGFMAGIAVCQSGACGDVDRFRTAPNGDPGITTDTGSYVVRSSLGDSASFNLNFGGHLYDDDDGAFNFDTSNSVYAQFRASSTGIGEDVLNAEFEGFVSADLMFEGGGTTSAYIDDNRFAALGLGTGAQIVGETGQSTAEASFALASAGLLGTSNLSFPAGTELNPEFARWGWWSAEIEAPLFTGGPRTDLLHLGNWVGGVRYDAVQDHIPFDGTAQFAGLAVGTMTNYANAERRIVGGRFDMTFDFGPRSGTLNLEIPAAGLDESIAVNQFGQAGDLYFGRNANPSTNTTTEVNGAFFANPAAPGVHGGPERDGIAATGGSFESVNFTNNTHTAGIFAGDRTSYTPGAGARQGFAAPAGGSNR